MNQQIENQIDKLLGEWSSLGFTHVAISTKNGKCFPINRELIEPLGSARIPFNFPGNTYLPSAGGDLFYELKSKEVRGALFKSLSQGDDYEIDDNLV